MPEESYHPLFCEFGLLNSSVYQNIAAAELSIPPSHG
jgi:hypothetical protein